MVIRALVCLALVGSLAGVARGQPADKQAQAKPLLDRGLDEFKRQDYKDALSDWKAANELLGTPLTAALVAQAQANLDHSRASLAVSWLADAAAHSAAQTVDKPTWDALARALTAVMVDAATTETDASKLRGANLALERDKATLADQVKKLSEENEILRHQMKTLEALVPTKDLDRLKFDKCAYGECNQ
jgi:hypothetical protein